MRYTQLLTRQASSQCSADNSKHAPKLPQNAFTFVDRNQKRQIYLYGLYSFRCLSSTEHLEVTTLQFLDYSSHALCKSRQTLHTLRTRFNQSVCSKTSYAKKKKKKVSPHFISRETGTQLSISKCHSHFITELRYKYRSVSEGGARIFESSPHQSLWWFEAFDVLKPRPPHRHNTIWTALLSKCQVHFLIALVSTI